jgi:hypothetical protein
MLAAETAFSPRVVAIVCINAPRRVLGAMALLRWRRARDTAFS